MKLRTTSSRLKAKMGQYMRAVRAGKEVVITDRDRPVARLLPYDERAPEGHEEVAVAQPRDPGAPPLGQLEVRAVRYRGRATAEMLEEDRARR